MKLHGDTEEDVAAHKAFYKEVNSPLENLQTIEKYVAIDYFTHGWNAAVKYLKDHKDE